MREKKIATFKDLARVIGEYDKIFVFPHINPDGDALGSSLGLTKALRWLGKEAFAILEDRVPYNFEFIIEENIVRYLNDISPQDSGAKPWDFSKVNDFFDSASTTERTLAIAVDCGDAGRLGERFTMFEACSKTMIVDHHRTTEPIADFSLIDSKAAATGELIYYLVKELGLEPGKVCGREVYMAILTDTGSFQYSNTRGESLRIAADLKDAGVDSVKLCQDLFERVPISKLKLETEILSNLEILADGKLAVSYCTEEMVERCCATMEDASGSVGRLRAIEGVEVAVMLKERNGKVNVSTRSKSYFDVSTFCQNFGGGGHIRAAGFTLDMDIFEAKTLVSNSLEKELACD